ncbi:MAG: aminopeptidase P family protein [Gemmatimonadales bacterium]
MTRTVVSVSAVLALTASLPLVGQSDAPGGPVPVALLQARRAALLQTMPRGVLVINASRIRSIEGEYPQDSDYREDNDFFYLTGIESPNGVLVAIQPDSGSSGGEVLLYLTAAPPKRDAWSASRTSADSAGRALTGLAEIRIRPAMRRSLVGGNSAAPQAGGQAAAPVDPMVSVVDSIAAAGGLSRVPSRTVMGMLRVVKDSDELRRLRRASEISAEAHREAMKRSRPGMWEYEVEALVEYTFRRHGAERVGYPSIVGSGVNSTILHYDLSRRQTNPGDVMLIDAAAEWGYFTADLTRTYPMSGRFTPRQRAIYDLVLGTQQAAIDATRPGVTIAEIQTLARAYMKDHSGDLCAPGDCTRYFIHGLSHWVGMDVHDVGPYFTPLKPGMTFTIEPGIYIPGEALGVRIEDVILVTATGAENLTKAAPRTAAEIEALMAEGRRGGR